MTFGSMADEAASLAHPRPRLRARASTSSTSRRSTPCRRTRSGSGAREEIVGKWLAGRPRDAVFLATKVAGPLGGWFQAPLRHGKTALDRHHVARAVRGEPAAARHRLRRPLPDPLARRRRADRRDSADADAVAHRVGQDESVAKTAEVAARPGAREVGRGNAADEAGQSEPRCRRCTCCWEFRGRSKSPCPADRWGT